MNRKSLRNELVSILKAANNPIFEDRVYPNRSISTDNKTVPAILVYSLNAPVDRRDEAPKSYVINQDIVIECITEHDTDDELSDELDDLSDAVIKIIEDSFFLEDECEHVTLTSLITETDGTGESPAGSTKITYSFGLNYEPRTDMVLDDLKTLDNNFKINDNQNNDAKSVIDLPQE